MKYTTLDGIVLAWGGVMLIAGSVVFWLHGSQEAWTWGKASAGTSAFIVVGADYLKSRLER